MFQSLARHVMLSSPSISSSAPPNDRFTPSSAQRTASGFSYSSAFDRNIGWLTEHEQAQLRQKRVAIAGMGGVGGSHLLTLARLGIGRFHIADYDTFEIGNFNRQAGAAISTIGCPKVEVLAAKARDINPESEIRIFPDGVHSANIDAFFEGVDLYIDGLDAFAFEARDLVFGYCAEHRIPATSVAPLGMSAALLNFMPGGMTFSDYFRLSGCSDVEKAIRFLVGFAPALLHRTYLVDATRVNLAERRGPSTGIACELCAGVASSEALKILLGRGKVWAAPHGIQFDGFRNRVAHTWRPGGNRHPLNRLAIAIAKRQLGM
jgi:molybdopterin/thiamine biosynthesis adenylyltransferase